MPRRPALDDRGETLIELMVAIAIMGIAVVAMLGAIANSIMLSGVHRKQAAAGVNVRAYAEAIEAAVALSPSGYRPCAAPSSVSFTPTAGYSPSTTRVEYWNTTTSTFRLAVPGCADSGVQRLTLQVASPDSTVKESLVVIIRKPCRSTDPQCTP